MKWKHVFLIVAISAASALGSVALYNQLTQNKTVHIGSAENGIPANYAGYFEGKTYTPADPVDLTKAASAAAPAVVHIKTKIPAQKITNNLPRRRSIFDDFFGNDFMGEFGPNIIPEQRASGSGVIISDDGYIVTNNHVISNENNGNVVDEITVTMADRKTFKARVIGRDPSSDIAVLKIDGTKLPYLVYGNSDDIKLGQWVLAIGYPLTLDATVTAGIVSATGRSININARQSKNETPVESFIQTDAAVNQGNSGGALVNSDGTLIGINSAILAPTGTYAGYSFAIPVNIVKKIVNDIVQYGDVQRGYLGVTYNNTEGLNDEQKKSVGIPTDVEGVSVVDVSKDGGAAAAGLKKGDVITKVNNRPVLTGIQMSAQIAGFRPGDKVPVTFVRNGKEATVNVTLTKKPTPVATNIDAKLGGELASLDKATASRYGVGGGVIVKKVTPRGLLDNARVQANFIITSVTTSEGEVEVNSVEDLRAALQNQTKVRVTGYYPGYSESYTVGLNLGE